MKFTTDKLYKLLPAIYRNRDLANNKSLEAFLKVITEQSDTLQGNISQLYDNWFIETCDEWVVPYIGDLVGVRDWRRTDRENVYSQRAFVANSIAYRRRKGTATMVEQLAGTLQDGRLYVVEFFELLNTAQNNNHLRPHRLATVNFHDANQMDLVNTPFDTSAHTPDLKNISESDGWYGIDKLGIFVWTLSSYYLHKVKAYRLSEKDPVYTFSPLGMDTLLFNRPRSESTINHLSSEINVPTPLRRAALHQELNLRRQLSAKNEKKIDKFIAENYALGKDNSGADLKRQLIEIIQSGKAQSFDAELLIKLESSEVKPKLTIDKISTLLNQLALEELPDDESLFFADQLRFSNYLSVVTLELIQ
ncbi:MAG: hypothetical protein IPG76_18445 [Acidobacteria bacterium]|nr:hypothetical protein [Acidobacteriota bacterium]